MMWKPVAVLDAGQSIDNGNETEWRVSAQRLPDYVVADLAQAASDYKRGRGKI